MSELCFGEVINEMHILLDNLSALTSCEKYFSTGIMSTVLDMTELLAWEQSIWRRRQDLNPGHIGERRLLSLLRHLCSPKNNN